MLGGLLVSGEVVQGGNGTYVDGDVRQVDSWAAGVLLAAPGTGDPKGVGVVVSDEIFSDDVLHCPVAAEAFDQEHLVGLPVVYPGSISHFARDDSLVSTYLRYKTSETFVLKAKLPSALPPDQLQ